MADLSAYSAISVEFDKTGPTITIRDISNYPVGVAAGITGVLSITQPDGIEIETVFPDTDITYVGGALTPAIKELRLASDGNFQKGLYTIIYTARHASYDDTVFTKTFNLYYTRPAITIVPAFDVFTPVLKVRDTSSYVSPGFTLNTVEREWEAVITNVGTVIGTDDDEFDIKYSGSYYDSKYAVTFTTKPTFESTTDATVTVIDEIEVTGNYKTKVPTSLNNLFVKIIACKKKIDDAKCCDKKSDKRLEFSYIMSLFEFYKSRGLCGAHMDTLIGIMDELELLLADCSSAYEHTYLAIPAYSFSDFCGCCGGAEASPASTAPVVQADTNEIITLPTSSITLIGTATGSGLTYLWTKESGPVGATIVSPTAATTDVTGLVEGTYVFKLAVTNNLSQTTYDTVTVTVLPEAVGGGSGITDIDF